MSVQCSLVGNHQLVGRRIVDKRFHGFEVRDRDLLVAGRAHDFRRPSRTVAFDHAGYRNIAKGEGFLGAVLSSLS